MENGYYKENAVNEDYTPIGMWGYVGYLILFGIPCIGFIFALVFSFGSTKNVNLRNLSRGTLILNLFGFLLGLIYMVVLVPLMVTQMGKFY